MGKVKPRVRTSKGKKWRKGQSGSSNPQTKKHRDAAKGKFGNHLSQASSRPSSNLALTTDVLATHDAVQEDVFLIDKIDNEEDDLYVEEATSQTGISLANSSVYSLIETSNPVFGRVKRLWNSPLESHRELCAVLAAVSEVIKSKNGNDTETEYFAALLTALESSGEEKSTTAISYLLSIVMEKVPVAVLQVEFGPTCKILSSCLTSHETSNSTSLLKSLVSCLTTLLSAQPLSIWSDSYIQRILQTLMNFTVHPKPRLRKNAQRGVAAMLREGSGVMDDDNFHPSCSLVAKYCKHVLDKGGIETTALHILGLLKDCVANFPAQHIKSICESILKLITLGKSIVKITGFHSLHGLFTSKAGPQGLTSQLNGQLISALYDHQPSIVDAQLLMAWITVMESAHIRLHSLDMSICLAHVSKFFAVCCQCLLAEKTTVVKLIADIMKNLLRECLPSALNVLNGEDKEIEQKELEQKKKKSKESHEYSTILSMYRSIENCLKYKYQSVWNLVLGVLETFYTIAGKQCSNLMTKSLQSLNELHNTPNFAFNSELEAAFGAAVKTMGPRVVLKAVPLKLDVVSDPPDFPQSWILPVLQDYVQCTEIAYYVEELLPIAGKMRVLSQTWKRNGKELEVKLFDTLEYQIWCLLSSFCIKPTDILTSFQSIAKILGTALTEKTEIRNMVCFSLKSLIEGSRRNDTDQAEIARFSKNYLPILFNLYTNDPLEGEPPREPILECIAAFLSITEQKLLQSFFSIVLTKLKDPDVQSYARIALEDIAEVFVPYLNLSSLVELFQLVSPILDSGNTTSQKKAYKLLAAILSCTSPEHTSFISEHLSELQSVLLSSLSTAGVGTKKPRLRCLINIVPHLTSDNTDFILAVIPEAIMCTKEYNEKCRSLSYQLLSSLGWSSQRLYLKSPEDSMREYFNMVIAGLAGSSHMVSATIGALARLVYEFHDLLGSQLIETLLNSVAVFLSAKVKEVVRSTLIFIKVAIGVLPQTELAPYVKDLIENILTWNENNKNHFRLKARVILERLIRKFSFEMVASFVPTKHRRLIIHIRKTNDRHKRKKREKWEETIAKNDDEDFIITRKPISKPSFEELIYDSDDDDTDKRKQFPVKGKKETQKARGRTWLKEGENDEPLNFLDPSVTQRVLGTNPSNLKKKQKSSDEFIFSNDGRLIINDDIQLEKTEGNKDLAILETENLDPTDVKRQKRKRGRSEDSDQDDDKFPLSAGAGAGGGSGIHRKDPVKMKFKDYGADYRAKKARGDIKKPGKPDPYAYIQLDRQKLNRRKRAKLSGQFQGILHKAHKGAALGRKQKGKRLKK